MDWINILVSNHLISIIVTVVTGIAAYIFGGKNKQKLEIKQSEVTIDGTITENVVKNLDVYQRMFSHLETQIDKLQARVLELEAELENLSKEYNTLKRQYEKSLNK